MQRIHLAILWLSALLASSASAQVTSNSKPLAAILAKASSDYKVLNSVISQPV